MDFGLAGKHALVLGASSGLGLGSAQALAAEGAAVTIASSNAEKLGAAAKTLAGAAKVETQVCNLSDAASVVTLLERVPQSDVLVLNGGGPPPGPVLDVDDDVWRAQFQTMFLSLAAIGRAHVPGMRERGFGRVIFITSSGTIQPIQGLGISNTIRKAVTGFAKTLANEVARDGVTVNCVAPGRIDTARLMSLDEKAAARRGMSVDAVRAESLGRIPTGRFGTAVEFGAVVCFLASRQAAYVNGSIIKVDGGLVGVP